LRGDLRIKLAQAAGCGVAGLANSGSSFRRASFILMKSPARRRASPRIRAASAASRSLSEAGTSSMVAMLRVTPLADCRRRASRASA
jgi:hypothetical protein